jgi:5-methylcytosine-specific restriction enzyme subunit McrC
MSVVSLTLQEWETKTPDITQELYRLRLNTNARIQAQIDKINTSKELTIRELWNGVEVSATSFVGKIQIGDLQIIITPKIDKLPLYSLFNYAYDLRNFQRYDAAEFAPQISPFQDLLILQLHAEAVELITRGLHRRYIKESSQLSSPRGRFEINEIVRSGGASLTTLPCTYYSRLEDCPVNQALLAGLRLAVTLTNNSHLRSQLYHVIRQLDEVVSTVRLTYNFIQSVMRSNTRLTFAYEPALRLINLLMEGMGLAIESSESTITHDGFLFDMNRFYQTLLTRFLSEYMPGNYRVESEYRMDGLFAYNQQHNPQNRPSPVVRPDLIVSQQGKMVAILDAKYRDIWDKKLPREMLYQLSLYAMCSERLRQSTILYPTMDNSAKEAIINLKPFEGVMNASVHLRPVNLLTIANLISKETSAQKQRECEKYAMYLAFGEY